MIFANANIFTMDGRFVMGSVREKNGIINQVFTGDAYQIFPKNEDVIDCEGNYLIPGLVDIHFHGSFGKDFCAGTEEAIQTLADYQAKCGVMAICPATMTFSEEILGKVMDAAAAHKNEQGADLVGINMEGPFISPNKIGAQNPKYVQKADFEMLQRLQERSGGLVKLVDVAPEEEGAIPFIEKASKICCVSIAHTCATYEEAMRAFEAGASHLTHLYNAMPGIHHRSPGPIVAAVEAGAEAELISDGIHSHNAAIRLAFRLFGNKKTILIADSCEAVGLPDGMYDLGGQSIKVTGNLAVLAEEEDTIAGSATNLYDCMKYAVKSANIDLETAVGAATINPAKSIGVDDKYGLIASGRYADLLVVDKDLNLKQVYKRGKLMSK